MDIWINRAGQHLGKYTLEEVQRGLDQGQFVATDLAWQEGMESWKPLSDFPGVRIPAAPVEPAAPAYPTPPPSDAVVPSATRPDVAPAWERRPAEKLFPAFFMTIRDVLFEPHLTFPRMPVDGRLMRPTTFFLMVQCTAVLISYAIWIAIAMVQLPYYSQLLSRSGELRNLNLPIGILFVLIPAAFVLWIAFWLGYTFLMAGVHHLVLMLLGGANKGYDATYKVVSYSSAAQVFWVIPYCGFYVIAPVFFCVSSIIGLSKVHGIEGWKSSVAILAPYVLCCLIIGGLYIGVIAMVVSQAQRS
jgi:hypothetical protein